MSQRKAYPSDVTDDEWAFVAPYLTLMREDAPQRRYPLRELLDAVRWMVKAGCPWRFLPNDLPPWAAVDQQVQRWLKAGCFEAMVHDLRELLRLLLERDPRASAAVLDARTLQSSPESGGRAGYDGCKRKNGSKVHLAVDTLGHLLALVVTPANEQEARSGGRADPPSARGHAGRRPPGLGGPRLHGRGASGCRRGQPRQTRNRQTGPSQARLRAPAPALGRGALLRLAGPFPAAFARLRTPSNHPGGAALAGVFESDAQELVQTYCSKYMTGSSLG